MPYLADVAFERRSLQDYFRNESSLSYTMEFSITFIQYRLVFNVLSEQQKVCDNVMILILKKIFLNNLRKKIISRL